MDVDVRFDPAPFIGACERVAKQIPYATSLAINRTLYEVRDELQEDLPRQFTIRSTWVSKGIRVSRAKKRSLEGAVGSSDSFMRRQAEGGVKESANGGLVAVPKGIRKTPAQRTTPSRWPGKLMYKKRHFISELPNGTMGLFKFDGRGKHLRVRLLYILKERVEVPKRWPFFEQALATIEREWPHQQVRAMLDALKGSKR